MLMSRLIYGCGHLTGGATRDESIKLVNSCLQAGLLHFDTAPSYGIGTAEALIGEVSVGDPRLQVTAKIGSRRPHFALAKTYARRVRRLLSGSDRRRGTPFEPVGLRNERPASGTFALKFMQESLRTSLRRLGRKRVEYLLLHEAQPQDVTPAVQNFLMDLLRRDIAGAVGVSSSAMISKPALAELPAEFVVQGAITPQMLVGPVEPWPRALLLHSLIKTSDWLGNNDKKYAHAVSSVANRFGHLFVDRATAHVVVPYCLVAANVADAKIIYASSIQNRLDYFLATVAHIDERKALEDISLAFREAYLA